jgi:hypothetical protein
MIRFFYDGHLTFTINSLAEFLALSKALRISGLYHLATQQYDSVLANSDLYPRRILRLTDRLSALKSVFAHYHVNLDPFLDKLAMALSKELGRLVRGLPAAYTKRELFRAVLPREFRLILENLDPKPDVSVLVRLASEYSTDRKSSVPLAEIHRELSQIGHWETDGSAFKRLRSSTADFVDPKFLRQHLSRFISIRRQNLISFEFEVQKMRSACSRWFPLAWIALVEFASPTSALPKLKVFEFASTLRLPGPDSDPDSPAIDPVKWRLISLEPLAVAPKEIERVSTAKPLKLGTEVVRPPRPISDEFGPKMAVSPRLPGYFAMVTEHPGLPGIEVDFGPRGQFRLETMLINCDRVDDEGNTKPVPQAFYVRGRLQNLSRKDLSPDLRYEGLPAHGVARAFDTASMALWRSLVVQEKRGDDQGPHTLRIVNMEFVGYFAAPEIG